MPTECSQDSFDFGTVEGRRIVGRFDGGLITSDAGAVLLGATNKAIRLVERFASCFGDARDAEQIEHTVATLIGQRVFGLALGYEDLNDHDQLRHDPIMAVLAGKLKARRRNCAPVAGKSTLNRLEHAPEEGPGYTSSRYHKISHDADAIERLFVTLFLEAHATPPRRIILDLDATDDPLHGHQEGRFFHGYYDCYCYLPLYVFCGRHLLSAKLRRSNIDASAGAKEEIERIAAQIRERWPQVRIILRADSGFAREELLDVVADPDDDRVPEVARECLAALGAQLRMLKAQVLEFDRRIIAWHRSNETSKRLDEIPGVGPALATALVASIANPRAFRSGRDFSAWVGLVPKQNSSGGKERLGSITKRGDRYLRSLFTAGALAVIRYAKIHGTKHRPWLTALLARRPTKVAAIALANKMARMAWAMMAKGERYKEPAALAA